VAIPAPTLHLVERTSILLVDPEAERFLPSLRGRFEVSAVESEEQAIRALRTFQPTLVVTELALPAGDGVSICRQAKASGGDPPSVLATTSVPERVPEALAAGCDGVLLKPFATNLLCTRIGRLLGLRAKALTERAMWQRATVAHLRECAGQVPSGTNVVHPDRDCPSCGHRGVVSFDAASHRRSWYACLPCGTVWLAE
jgi:CheY-like chemotaxis protein